MRILSAILMWTIFLSPNAHAESETKSSESAEVEEKSTFEVIDSFFGQYFVAPLGSVMFFDLYPFDDTLAMGEGIGETVDGSVVLSFKDGEYTLAKQSVVSKEMASPTLLAPIENENPYFKWTLQIQDDNLVAITPAGTYEQLDVPLIPIEEFESSNSNGTALLNSIIRERDESQIYFVTTALTIPEVPVVFHRDRVIPEEEDEVEGNAPPFHLIPASIPVGLDYLLADLEKGGHINVGEGKSKYIAMIDEVKEDSFVATSVNSTTRKEAIPNSQAISLPIVVVWLVLGAVFFTFRMSFINLRGFWHAIIVTTGKYDSEEDTGEVSHFQALSSALSATVGLGNIAGVAIAISVGGPGAIFWMVIAGFLGMSSKFTECTLGQLYRVVDPETKRISGGPMRYLDLGLKEKGLPKLGKVLASIFAVMCIGGSLGGGNMFQANQSFVAISELLPNMSAFVYGVILAVLVGIVIIGGIKSIGKVAGVIVPLMCGIYVMAGLYILLVNASEVPSAFGVILTEAFAPTAVAGGAIGALIQGFRRAAFSNEAGVGSASIAHSAASTEEPVREGIVALLEPFIDTIIVCTMTGLVVVITGAYQQPDLVGVAITSYAFASVIDWFPYVLSVAVFFFAFSTMISWSYYGERCVTYLLGESASLPYKIFFCLCVIFGSVVQLGNVLEFSDLMILGMAFPNILGLFILSSTVRAKLDDYWARLKSGEMEVTS
jgi:alanine or glycine:cation symporter, AGCS family